MQHLIRAGTLCAAALLLSRPALGHGMWGHIQVTGWAVENMPDDELRAFLLEPEVFNALLFGATFTDTGYATDDAASNAYSEHTHWEPFIEDFITWIRVNDPPPWETLESRQRVAFLLGCASHGLQDSIFDSLFLYQVEEHDGAGQDKADPGTDGFLVLDGHVRFVPEPYMPMETLLELYAPLNAGITEEVITSSVSLVTALYINDEGGLNVAATLGGSYEAAMPWTRTHYLDPEIPGSLRAEIYPTMRHQQAVWARLHEAFDADEATVFAYPESPRRLLSHDHTTAGSWISLIFGAGVAFSDDLMTLTDADGVAVPMTLGNNRWGAEHTRLVRVMPEVDLEPGGWYTAQLRADVALITGQTSQQPWSLTFQVSCDGSNPDECPDLGEIPAASIDGIPEATDTGGEAEATGCSCASAGSAPPAGLALMLLLPWWRRRVAEP